MSRLRDRKFLAVMMNQAGFRLPFTVDFSTLADGALPPQFTGATWAIVSGKAVNTPTEGSELFARGDMEGTAGFGTHGGSGSVQSDEQAHGGTYSRKVVASGATEGFFVSAWSATAGLWYALRGWIYVSAGNPMIFATSVKGSFQEVGRTGNAGWTEVTGTQRAITTKSDCAMWGISTTGGGTGYFDDYSAKLLTGVWATIPASKSLATVKASWRILASRQSGVIVCSDKQSDQTPLNYVMGFYDRADGKCYLIKCVNGTITDLLATTTAYVDGAPVEVRHTATDTFQLWYNNAQVGTDQTISDATITANKIHGIFSTGGSQLDSFFVGV
jgi:hypothetical protein